ncbi:biorientation of chromosomes in cell division protein 1-like 1 isoform X1 [Vanessa atalanta]|uniref:biorientation of chromosomes in cell division protein 1-like 1 isoform X1 n=1 Tax=Vanessa atalanta TaxID=42275 RepID=UPI001FCD6D81|nr:biorientation of chromosomes in cell division protein 1-like 1 isoform X1 [Vanessa atalanta]
MAHLQYMPGDPRLVDQLVYELKSKGIFDQFRKDCIADVDTRPAYQNLRQRVENSVSTFLSRQTWQPDLNKNQLREKLRKHILDGNYLEQGVERIVDQVVNPKVASVFIPKVEDLVYNYLGIARKKSVTAETSNGKIDDLLPTDLEAVSPGSVKSNDDKNDSMELDDIPNETKMDVDEEKPPTDIKENNIAPDSIQEEKAEDIQLPSNEPNTDEDKSNIPLPSEEIKPENIPPPENSPPKVELEKIELPKEPILSTDIPLPDDITKEEKEQFFKPINSDDDDSSSDSSLRRNMSPLTPIRNFNNENSCDAQQAFENDLVENKDDDNKEPNSFKFTIDAKSPENSCDAVKPEKKDTETNLAYQFNNQVNINHFNTPLYEDSSNSNILHIDYESDANSKINQENKALENDQNSEDSRKDRKSDEKKSSHKSSHRSRDYYKHSSSRDKKSDSKQSSSRDSSKHDKSKSSKEESKSKSSDKERSRDRSDKKDSRESSRHRSSHKSSHRDSKSHRSSSSSHRHSSKHSDEKKTSSSSSSNQKDKDKSSDKNSMDKPRESKSSSHRSDKDRKSSSGSSKSEKSSSKNKNDDKDKNKKSKKDTDDHYSLSGRGNPNRRSTDRDSNDGSSSSKGSSHPSGSKTTETKKESKSSSKSESTSTASGESTSPSDKENVGYEHGTKIKESLQQKPVVRIDSHLEQPVVSPPRLPFVPDVTIKKPKFAANLEEAKRLMKMRKFLDEEQKRMNQEAALLLEFQANVRPSLSQVYSSIPGPELEFACVTATAHKQELLVQSNENINNVSMHENVSESHYTSKQLLNVLNDASVEVEKNSINKVKSANVDVDNGTLVSSDNIDEISNAMNTDLGHNRSNEAAKPEPKGLTKTKDLTSNKESKLPVDNNRAERFEITVIAEELSEQEDVEETNTKDAVENIEYEKVILGNKNNEKQAEPNIGDENKFHYFAEHEKYNAEIERARFEKFLKAYNVKSSISNKIYLINCDSYEENILREMSANFGEYEIVNYHRNGHLKLSKTRNVIKNVNISSEISLPIDADYEAANDYESFKSHVFSPDKSECSFELSSDYDAKLEEMVNKTSRQEIMEIILGNVVDASPSKMPRIDYLTDSNIDSECENNLKRKMSDVETTVNNNRQVLTPNKIRKMSTDQISSTTQENEEISNKIVTNTRSKYLGKARRVGLPRLKRPTLPNSPSSDKSVENYEQNSQTTPQTPNGKIKRNKVQRYDTSDLYKPKLHFLSRRNHIT